MVEGGLNNMKKMLDVFMIIVAMFFAFCLFKGDAYEGAMGFAGIELENFQKESEFSSEATKLTISSQYYENVGTIDMLTAKRLGVMVKVFCVSNECYNTESKWTTIEDKEIGEIKYDLHTTYAGFPGIYKLKLKNAEYITLLGTRHSGGWFLDENRLP